MTRGSSDHSTDSAPTADSQLPSWAIFCASPSCRSRRRSVPLPVRERSLGSLPIRDVHHETAEQGGPSSIVADHPDQVVEPDDPTIGLLARYSEA